MITRIRATFDLAGDYVWRCHIVEHEDDEMMRPRREAATPAGLQEMNASAAPQGIPPYNSPR